jgi:hypothetical protein
MSVVSSEIATDILEPRGAALTLIAVVLKTTDLEALSAEVDQRDGHAVRVRRRARGDRSFTGAAGQGAGAFRRAHCAAAPPPHGARGGNHEQMAAAFAAGLVEATEGVRVPRTHGASALSTFNCRHRRR